jgi:hypothetical protein
MSYRGNSVLGLGSGRKRLLPQRKLLPALEKPVSAILRVAKDLWPRNYEGAPLFCRYRADPWLMLDHWRLWGKEQHLARSLTTHISKNMEKVLFMKKRQSW